MGDPAPQQVPQGGEDQTVEDGPFGSQRPARPARGVQGARVGDRCFGGHAEDLLLRTGRPGVGGVVDLLEDAWNRRDEGGPKGGQIGHQILHVRGVPEHPARGTDDQQFDEAAQDVRQWQEEQSAHLLGLEEFRQMGAGVDGQVDEVAVGELGALGTPGRSRGVDDGGRIGAGQAGGPAIEVGCVDVLAVHDEVGQCPSGDG